MQRRHDADHWIGYESGWKEGETWGSPAPRRQPRPIGQRIRSALMNLIIKIAGH